MAGIIGVTPATVPETRMVLGSHPGVLYAYREYLVDSPRLNRIPSDFYDANFPLFVPLARCSGNGAVLSQGYYYFNKIISPCLRLKCSGTRLIILLEHCSLVDVHIGG